MHRDRELVLHRSRSIDGSGCKGAEGYASLKRSFEIASSSEFLETLQVVNLGEIWYQCYEKDDESCCVAVI